MLADREEIGRFVDALFRYATADKFVSLRSFHHDPRRPPADIRTLRLRLEEEGLDPLVRTAVARATYVANLVEPAVFAPPICTFRRRNSAKQADLAEGLALSVECDVQPAKARATLEGLLGPATVVVASGGAWADPETGEAQDKVHLHWRLSEPTRENDEHAGLKQARRLATLLVGGDPSAVPLVHPLRWPGSWHRKAEPRLAWIVAYRPDREIHLDDAVDLLDGAVGQAGLKPPQSDAPASMPGSPADATDLLALAHAIPNAVDPDPLRDQAERWAYWNRIGMAFFAASGGSNDGRRSFEAWSAKRPDIHDSATTVARWEHYHGSPPDRIGIGTLIQLARFGRADFQLPSRAAGRVVDEKAAGTEDPRLELKLGPAWVNDTARRCAGLLDEEVFLRGALPMVLVRVEDVGRDSAGTADRVTIGGVEHPAGSLIFAEPTPERVMYRLDERVRFLRYDARTESWVATSCPQAIARRIIGAAPEVGFRPCAGVVHVPIFEDGRIIASPGYDARRRVYLDLADGLAVVPDKPAKVDAERALEIVLAPFKAYLAGREPADVLRLRCGIAAAALTAVLRASLPAAPATLIDANVPGAGKGKMARALASIATGRPPAVVTEGPSDEETEKRLATAILSGAPAILLDNLQRTLSSSTLESGLTEGTATIRLFGRLVDVTVPVAALVLVTANNAALRADMLRRTLPVRIVADTDRPELRRFAFDPYQEAARRRREIVTAGLTIARAWWFVGRGSTDGQRIRQTTLGSFEAWAELVAGAVEWLTGMNPVSLIEERKAEDPIRGEERRVIAALFDLFGERPWTAKEATGKQGDLGAAATGLDPDIWAAVISFKGDRPTPHQVGIWLRRRKDKVFGDLQLAGEIDRDGVARWQMRGMRGIAGMRLISRGKMASLATPVWAMVRMMRWMRVQRREGEPTPATPRIPCRPESLTYECGRCAGGRWSSWYRATPRRRWQD